MTEANGPRANRWVAIWLLVLGLGLAAFGQAVLSLAPESVAVGAAAYAASFLVLLALARVLRGGRQMSRLELYLVEWARAVGSADATALFLTFVAAAAMGLCVAISQSQRPPADYWPGLIAWIVGIGALAAGLVVLPARARWPAWRAALAAARLEFLAVLGLTGLAFLLRVLFLTQIPYPFAGDEGSIGQEGQRILSGALTNMFITGWQSEASMSFLPWAISMALFGQTILGLRLFAAVVGALTIPCVYLLARDLFNRPTAFLAAALLAVMAPHIHFSRIAVNNIENPFFACLVFWLVYRAVETRRGYVFGAAGLAAGLALYTFVGSRLVLILAGGYLVLTWLGDRTRWKEWRGIVVFGLAAGLAALPLALYFMQHTDIAFARMNQVGILQNGWLADEASKVGEPAGLVFAHLLLDSFLVFVSAPARHGFYNSPDPLLDSAWSFFFILGLVFSLARMRERRHLLLQLWFWSVLFFGSALMVPPPSAERLAMSYPVVVLFAAWGIWNVASLAAEALGARQWVQRGLMAAAAVALAGTSLAFYFLEYTPGHYYGDVNSEVAQELGVSLGALPRETRVYFLGEPRMFYDFPSIPFLSGYLDGMDVPPEADVAALVDRGRPAVFVALPERASDLERIRALYAGGTYEERGRVFKPEERLYLVYAVDPGGGAR